MLLEAPEKVVEADIPEPKETGASVIQVTGTGICATDWKIFTGGIPVKYPLVMGHEIVGELVEGTSRDGAKPGAKVLIDPVLTCGNCFHCQHGQSHLCPVGELMGRERNGGFAEIVAVRPENVYALPDGIDLTAAPMMQVLTTCLHASEMARIEPGETVVITGLGVTGQMHIQLAKAAGAGTVIGVSRNPPKRGLALKLGADLAVNHGEEADDAVLSATDGRGADVIIESVGALPVLGEAMDLARIGGRIVPFGIYTANQAELPFYQFYFKELQILNARAAQARDFPASIELVANGKLDIASLLSHQVPFQQLGEAMGLLTRPGLDRMKVVLTYDD